MSEPSFNRSGSQTAAELNPWQSMWLHPRLTMRHLLATNPRYGVLLLAMAGGINSALESASNRNMGDTATLVSIIAGGIIGGIIGGIVGLYVGSWLIRWTGGWIGGQGTSETIRTALGWANLPNLLQLLLWVGLIAVFRGEIFAKEMPMLEASPTLWGVLIISGLVSVVLAIWSFVLLLAALSEVQGFSALRAFGNLLLAGLIPALVIAIILVVIVGIFFNTLILDSV